MGEICLERAAAPLAATLVGRIADIGGDGQGGRAAAAISELAFLCDSLVAGEDTRAALGEAALRARALVAAGDADERTAAAVFGGEAACALVLDRAWTPASMRAVVEAVADAGDAADDSVALDLYLRASRSPELLELPPLVAAEAQLRLLCGLAPVTEASLWLQDSPGERPACAAVVGEEPTRRVREVAESAVAGATEADAARGSIHGEPITRWQQPVGALVVRGRPELRGRIRVFLREGAAALAPVLERQLLLERNADRERSLVDASERRLVRLGFDLHDGPLQEAACLKGELLLFANQLDAALPDELKQRVRGRFADVDARLVELDRGLRELSQSLESTSALERPLERVLEREVGSFRRRAGIEAELRISGSTDGLTRSQKLVVFRAVQEALSNAREHSGAERVEVSVESRREGVRVRVTDDGGGFDVSRTLIEAARRGRLGVVGISERVRLLGGTFDIDSRPGGPTSIELMLPRWEPLRAAAGAVGGAQTS